MRSTARVPRLRPTRTHTPRCGAVQKNVPTTPLPPLVVASGRSNRVRPFPTHSHNRECADMSSPVRTGTPVGPVFRASHTVHRREIPLSQTAPAIAEANEIVGAHKNCTSRRLPQTDWHTLDTKNSVAVAPARCHLHCCCHSQWSPVVSMAHVRDRTIPGVCHRATRGVVPPIHPR